MTENEAERALKHLEAALEALGAAPAEISTAKGEIAKALALLTGPTDNVYADKSLRPGLNQPTKGAADV